MAGDSADRITTHCPACGKRFVVDAKFVDREVKCSACQARFRVTRSAHRPAAGGGVRSEPGPAAQKQAEILQQFPLPGPQMPVAPASRKGLQEPERASAPTTGGGIHEKAYHWGLGLIGIGLVGLILPTFGLQLRRLRALGEMQWMVLVAVVAVGCGAVLWSRHQRIKLSGMIAGGALAASLLFAYLSFWRHASDAPVAQDAPGASHGRAPAAQNTMLAVTFENVNAHEDFAQLIEFMRDAIPEANSGGGHVTGKQDPQTGKFVATSQHFTFGPVADVDAALKRIQFGKPTLQSGNKLVVDVQYPLPSRAASIQHRVAYGLQELRSRDPQRLAAGIRLLESLEPLDRRDEVATELIALLKNLPPMVSVTQCLMKWGTPQQAGEITGLLKAENANQHELLLILSAISPDDAVREAVALIPKNERVAVETLRNLGTRSEKSVIPLLSDSDEKVQVAACWVLQVVGTASSLGPLEEVAKSNKSQGVAEEARQAIEKIQQRAKKAGATQGGA